MAQLCTRWLRFTVPGRYQCSRRLLGGMLALLLLPWPGSAANLARSAPAGQPLVITAEYAGTMTETDRGKDNTLRLSLTWDRAVRRVVPWAGPDEAASSPPPTDTFTYTVKGSVSLVSKYDTHNDYSCTLKFNSNGPGPGNFYIQTPQYVPNNLSTVVSVQSSIPRILMKGGLEAKGSSPWCAQITALGTDLLDGFKPFPAALAAIPVEIDTTVPLLAAAPVVKRSTINTGGKNYFGGTTAIRIAATFKVAEQKSSCRIYYPDGNQEPDVSSQTVRVVLGQPISLRVSCGVPIAAGPIRWTVSGVSQDLKTTSAVGDYQIVNELTRNSATVTPFNMSALAGPEIHFRFVRGSTFPIDVTTGSGNAHTTFTVVDPVLQAPPEVSFCRVDVGSIIYRSPKWHAPTDPSTLGLGLNDSCGPVPGVRWRFVVALPRVVDCFTGKSIGGGTIRLTQLVTEKVANRLGPCLDQRERLADVTSFYDTVFPGRLGLIAPRLTEVKGGAGETVTWEDSDSPWIHLKVSLNPLPNRYTKEFHAWDYVMYRSDVPGSIWIPIGELIWHWNGTALYAPRGLYRNGVSLYRWELVPGSEFNPTLANSSFTNKVIAPLPQWSRAFDSQSMPTLC